jgi:hypothetical protein
MFVVAIICFFDLFWAYLITLLPYYLHDQSISINMTLSYKCHRLLTFYYTLCDVQKSAQLVLSFW